MIWKFISIGLLTLSAFLFIREISKIRRHAFIDGTVVSFEEDTDEDGTSYKPRVEYLDMNDRKLIYTSRFSSNPRTFNIGDKLKLLYDRETNSPVGILHFAHRFLGAFIIFVIAITILLFSSSYSFQLKIFEWIKGMH